MPFDRSRESLADIVENIGLAREFTAGFDLAAFSADRKTFHAVVRAIEIVSEASRRLKPEMRARHAQIPWRQIAAVGNVYRHEYHLVETEMVWKAVHEALPVLRAAVEAELARQS